MKCMLIIIITLFFSADIFAQQLNPKWEEALKNELKQYKACEPGPENELNPCIKFTGEALKTVYKINDFYASALGRHMVANEIAQYLEGSKKWILLGHGYEQKALAEAQTYANAKKAVVAVYLDENGIGLVSLILPGELKLSGTWGLEVPNSSAFIISEPEKSYVGKGLSFAVEKKNLKRVLLYARSY